MNSVTVMSKKKLVNFIPVSSVKHRNEVFFHHWFRAASEIRETLSLALDASQMELLLYLYFLKKTCFKAVAVRPLPDPRENSPFTFVGHS